jgi:hypothetical protein
LSGLQALYEDTRIALNGEQDHVAKLQSEIKALE